MIGAIGWCYRHVGRLVGDRSGNVLLEFGFAVSILATLTMGGVEIARYVLMHQKLERVVASVGDLISQVEILTTTHVTNMFDAAQHVIKPFELADNGVVVVSSVSGVADSEPQINWQMSGGGSLIAPSQIGIEGGDATLPAGFTLVPGDTAIIAEVFYEYTPWMFEGVAEPGRQYHRALFRPRYGSLSVLDPPA
jgi:Flp pilus assembly protein TadG